MTPRVPALPALTGLRFVAALLVVLFHVHGTAFAWAPAWAQNVLANGYAGVSLFFVLSGFILAYTYLYDAEALVPCAGFCKARFARVYPVYLLGLLATVPDFFGDVARYSHGAADFAWRAVRFGGPSVVLVQAWSPAWASQWNSPGWSLSAEAFFYACFPLVAAVARPLPRRGLLGLAAVAWAVAMLWPAAYLAQHAGGVDASTTWVAVRELKFRPIFHLPEFVLGVAAGRAFVMTRRERIAHRWLLLGSAAAIVVTLALAGGRTYLLVHNGLLAPAFALLVIALACGGTWVARLLSTRTAIALGEASYALYILHLPLHAWWTRLVAASGARVADGVALGAYVAASVGVSVLVFRYVEEPMRRIIRGWLGRSTEGRSGAAGPALTTAHESALFRAWSSPRRPAAP